MIARRHFADLYAVFQHCITVTGNRLVSQFDADDALRHAVGFLLQKGFLADEFFFLELAEHRQASHHRRNFSREFVAVERQADLEAQCVATAESAGLAASAGDEFVPIFDDEFVGTIDFKAVLARVARA